MTNQGQKSRTVNVHKNVHNITQCTLEQVETAQKDRERSSYSLVFVLRFDV